MTAYRNPPAFCPEHGLFPATNFSIAVGATNSGLYGCGQECPQCGRQCEIIPGVYNPTETGLDVLLDGSISPEALAAIKNLAERLQSGEILPEQAKAEAEKISPKVGKLFDIANWPAQAQATLYSSIIGAAAALIIASKMTPSPSPTVNNPPTAIERVIGPNIKDQLLSSSASTHSRSAPTARPQTQTRGPGHTK